MKSQISLLLENVKRTNPLIHHITNYVTANDCANIVLAIGGSPVMADDFDEVEEMVSVASALVINIGTLNSRTIDSMILAGKKANALNIPVILDPVGVKATKLRTHTVNKLLDEVKFSIIRGNMSEIKAIAGLESNIKGVDSNDTVNGSEDIAKTLALDLKCVIAITGAKDIISNGRKTTIIENGHPLLSKITGTGCMSTSLIGTFSSVTNDYYLASIAGILSMGIAGEMAYDSLDKKDALGTFRVSIIDSISALTSKDILEKSNLEEKYC
ncbi:hydroxyethylthiazole kinase ThiM [Gottschalkia purinilytica]|uniref:Hydroxyethylthiazole kinase n=1 Tax=Gottschalkia purinilytica TaxID=1503 RepID=A0A0L0WFF0_GOTPU|nr:hydroxyethylthiazole kinase [Gottschalkia purinilytica]KNF10194.1 hydroxyethylthiazole kinase ThiM [Gottschalkia purinilytica]